MQEFITQKLLWFYQRDFIRVTRQTFVSLFPFILLSTLARVIAMSVFTEYGFINRLFSVSSWFPFFSNSAIFFSNFSSILGGLIGLLTTYFAAKYTTALYGGNDEIAGITALIFSLIINSRELFSTIVDDGFLTRVNLPAHINLVVAVFLGYLVGQIFRIVETTSRPFKVEINRQSTRLLRPILFSLFLAILFNALFYLVVRYNVFTNVDTFFKSFLSSNNNLLSTFTNAILTTLYAFIGMSSAYDSVLFTDDAFSVENLTYVLQNRTNSGIPHPYTETTLYHGFGAFGGLGSLLALIIAILLVSKNEKNRRVSILGMFPALFNNGAPVMLGVPVMFNFLFLIPFLLTPLINMAVAYFALALKIMPPVVYPVPAGTPSPLIAFVGTGGSLRALAVALIAFISNIFVYIPFVKLNDRIHEKLAAVEAGGNDEKTN